MAGGVILVLLGLCLAVHNFRGMDTKCDYALGGLIDSLDVYGLLLTHAYAQDKRWPYISLLLFELCDN